MELRDAVVATRVGRECGAAGQSLTVALDKLAAYARSRRCAVGVGDVLALAKAWADEVVSPVGRAMCEDPLDGLATLPHLRTRLAEVYREAERNGDRVRCTYAFVVIAWDAGGTDPLDRLATRVAVGAAARRAFDGGETAAALGPTALVVLVARRPGLAATALRALPPRLRPAGTWIEPLPDRLGDAYALLDRLAGDLA